MISYKYGSHIMDMGVEKTGRCSFRDIPSVDTRRLGAVTPPRKSYSSGHTIAPAYNKGGYMYVTSAKMAKDLGK